MFLTVALNVTCVPELIFSVGVKLKFVIIKLGYGMFINGIVLSLFVSFDSVM